MSFELRILGELQVVRDGVALALPASKKTRALLGFLAGSAREHHRERLCAMFWDGPGDARAGLRWSLTKLRPVLDDERPRLLADREHVHVELGDGELDLARLRAVVQGQLASASIATLVDAAELVRGELLGGLELHDCFRWQQWCIALRDEVQGLHRALLAALVQRLADDPARALVHARARAAIDSFDERAHAEVIGLLARLGRVADAQRAYEAARRLIPREGSGGDLERARWQLGRSTAPSPEPEPAPAITIATPVAHAPTLPELAGRSGELAAAIEVVERRRGGETVLVVGDPGIGKTTVLEHLAAHVRAGGGTVAWGRGFEAELVRPYGAWIDALRSVGHSGAIEPLARDAGERVRLFDAVVELLRGLGCACLVVLDDVQWLDEASSALLHFAARALVGSGVTLACGARPGELADNAGVLRTIRGLAREHALVRLELGPLDPTATAALLRSHGIAPDLEVFGDSGGNPLFALELARARARGSARSDTLDALIRERLDALPTVARELVGWAAVFGRSFADDRLLAVTGLPPGEVITALDELERRGIVSARTLDGSASHDFVHDLVREAAYRACSESRRRASHLQIARILAALPDPEHGLAGDVARHAALGRDPSLCANACMRAAGRALELFATREVRELVGLGREQLVALPTRERIAVEIRLLRIAILSERIGRVDPEIEQALKLAIEEAHASGAHDDAAFGLHALSIIHHDRGDYDEAREDTLRAETLSSRGDAAAAAQSLANTGMCLAVLERDIARAEASLAEAEQILVGARAELPETMIGRGLVARFRGDAEVAIGQFERGLAIAERAQNHYVCRTALLGLAQTALEHGRPALAIQCATRMRRLTGPLGHGSEGALALAIEALGHAQESAGDHDGAIEAGLQALRDVDHRAFLAYTLEFGARLDAAQGELVRARARLTEALVAATAVRGASQLALVHTLTVDVAGRQGDAEAAAQHRHAARALLDDPERLSARARAAIAALGSAAS